MALSSAAPMTLLIDENVPNSVAAYFQSRGHTVIFVRDVAPAGSPDPVVAAIGNDLTAIVVTWDRDFEKIVSRVPEGNRAKFRKLGRIGFRCNETRGVQLLSKWIDHIEFHYSQSRSSSDFRMIIQIQESGMKFM